MIKFDYVVDAGIEWYGWKEKQKRDKDDSPREGHEANVPRAGDHGTVYKGHL